jgi:hypothetical protein
MKRARKEDLGAYGQASKDFLVAVFSFTLSIHGEDSLTGDQEIGSFGETEKTEMEIEASESQPWAPKRRFETLDRFAKPM